MKAEHYRVSGITAAGPEKHPYASEYELYISDGRAETYSDEVDHLKELHRATGKHYALAYMKPRFSRLEYNIGEPTQFMAFSFNTKREVA